MKKTSRNYNSIIRVWQWLASKIMEIIHCSQIFTKFIQIQNRYPIALDKTSILDKAKIFPIN